MLSLNNSWRVAIAALFLLGSSWLFVHLTLNGNPANALHSWGQSACLTVSVGILACLAGFKPLADFALTFRK